MTRRQSDIQDTFLNLLRKEGTPVTLYLFGGVSLRGTVRGFDTFTIELDTPGRPVQAVYKRSVASVAPMRPLRGLPAVAAEVHPPAGGGADESAEPQQAGV